MPVEMRIGDVFAADDADAFAHGCNCAGAMGAGIAVQFKRRWPRMYDEYRSLCAAGSFRPGDVFLWRGDGATIFNLGTQATWRVGATEAAVRTSLERMARMADEFGVGRIAMPRVGAGLGGLPWPSVESIVREVAGSCRVTLSVYSLR